ncbi:pirin family protein [Noviherbaspirillum sp.]|uniref:pirin family protein n=1 Tax=Noviherbaspirillum sp. TaxID=1926288 RepID=UPI002D6EE523|nr:pirin family protein [Noviherbaspirillum sp.]HZW19742.1 pirin family protein [Noviherbaspirillum sp.]
MATRKALRPGATEPDVVFSPVVRGQECLAGAGFRAKRFCQAAFGGLMDPILAVEHFVETESAFRETALKELAMLTLMFEDSAGHAIYTAPGGESVRVSPGDMHWLTAGRGFVHRENLSEEGGRIHGLRIFVGLPDSRRTESPYSIHLPATGMSRIHRPAIRSRHAKTPDGPGDGRLAHQIFASDIFLNPRTRQQFMTPAGLTSFLLVVDGAVQVYALGRIDRAVAVAAGEAVAFRGRPGEPFRWRIRSPDPAHVVVLYGGPLSGEAGSQTEILPDVPALRPCAARTSEKG